MKLLAKTAEERYQTASGAASDLRRCLAEWETHHRIDEFPLGEQDTPDRLLIPEKLYGRESEINALLAAFDRVVAGEKPELVLVSGYSGIGKSSVVNELHKSLVPPRGLVCIRQIRSVQTRHPVCHFGAGISEPCASAFEQERGRVEQMGRCPARSIGSERPADRGSGS